MTVLSLMYDLQQWWQNWLKKKEEFEILKIKSTDDGLIWGEEKKEDQQVVDWKKLML